MTAAPLSTREARWVLRRCGRKGHELAWVADPLSADLERTAADPPLLRCLRCGAFVTADDPAVAAVHGTREVPVPLADVPLAVRGSHGRKLALLRVVAIERALRALMLLLAAGAVFALVAHRESVLAKVDGIIRSAYPLAAQLHWDLANSHLIAELRELLGASPATYNLLGAGLIAYAALQFVEAFGLWGGWRWAEYLAVVATAVFLPLEVYELVNRATPLKVVLLLANLAIVAYLIYKGRLFGLRGGLEAYLREIRQHTLLGTELTAEGRDPDDQTSTVMV